MKKFSPTRQRIIDKYDLKDEAGFIKFFRVKFQNKDLNIKDLEAMFEVSAATLFRWRKEFDINYRRFL